MEYRSSKEFQMMVRLEKLSHKTSNPELDYNTAGQIQIHQPTLKNNDGLNILEENMFLCRRIPINVTKTFILQDWAWSSLVTLSIVQADF